MEKLNIYKKIFFLLVMLISFESNADTYEDMLASCQATAMVLQTRTKLEGALSTMKEVEKKAELKGIKVASNKNAYYGRVVYFFDIYLKDVNSTSGNKVIWDLFDQCKESSLFK
jgi:hypothetical protein